VQGIGAALMNPTLSAHRDLPTAPAQRLRWLGGFCVAAIGPIVGGLLTEDPLELDLFINIPVGVLGVIAVASSSTRRTVEASTPGLVTRGPVFSPSPTD
jgi:hypothetical protein